MLVAPPREEARRLPQVVTRRQHVVAASPGVEV